MSSFSKVMLSGGVDGRGVKVAATSIGSGTTIHTATADATLPDLITLFAMNSDTATRVLTLGWGGTADPDDLIKMSIPSQVGLVLVTADLPLRNTLIVKAACDAASKVILFGYVNRIS